MKRTKRQGRRLSESEWYACVAERIRSARLDRGFTQEQLAEAVGMSRPSIVNIEAGRQNTTLVQLNMIARELGVWLRDLLPDGGSI